jgi:hypothetical protein
VASDTFGALAQSTPAATTLTDAYTVPAARRAELEVIICNRSTATTIRLQHAVAGAASANGQYLLYDFALGANEAQATARFTVAASDVVRVYSASGSVTFNINGIEEDA